MPPLEQALTGLVRAHYRPWLALPLAAVEPPNAQSDTLSTEMPRRLAALTGGEPAVMAPEPTSEVGRPATPAPTGAPLTFARAVTLPDTTPRVNRRGGAPLVAEWGVDMARSGTAARLAAWSGGAPGDDESAGQQRAGKSRTGNHLLRAGLTQMAHAAARTKGTSLSALYQRLAARRGKKRALMAVAHSVVVSACHRLSRHEPSRELGANDFDEGQRPPLVDRLTRWLERLGDHLRLDPVAGA